MNILFCAKSPDATKHYRVDIPAKYLLEAGESVRIAFSERIPQMPGANPVTADDLKWADVVIFQRPVTLPVMKMMAYIRKLYPELPILADYDDNYYDVPRWNPGYPHLKTNEDTWQALVESVDGVVCSTEPLSEVMRRHVKKGAEVTTILNGFDFEPFDELKPWQNSQIMAPDPKQSQKLVGLYDINTDQFNDMAKDRTVVAWAGSKFHYCDLDWLQDSIEKVCKERDDIIFLFVGYLQGNLVKKSQVNRLFITQGIPGVNNFYRLLSSFKIDIMLAPLHPNKFNACKSNLKLMEAMSLGAYPMCSDWDAYEYDLSPEFHDDEVYGSLIGYEPNAWANEIMKVSEKFKDRDWVKKFKTVNDAYMRCNHSADLRSQQYVDFFRDQIEKRKLRAKAKAS